jgi:hypothetical protein
MRRGRSQKQVLRRTLQRSPQAPAASIRTHQVSMAASYVGALTSNSGALQCAPHKAWE